MNIQRVKYKRNRNHSFEKTENKIANHFVLLMMVNNKELQIS